MSDNGGSDASEGTKAPEEFKFSHCPNCNSDKTIARENYKRALAEGRMLPGLIPCVSSLSSPQIDKRIPHLVQFKAEIITALLDICSKCGTVYAVQVEIHEGVINQQAPPSERRGGPSPLFGSLGIGRG